MTENLLEKLGEQRFIYPGLAWEQFKAIQAGFEGVPGVKVAYFEGMLEIVTPSKQHEAIKWIIATLLVTYLVENDIAVFPSGSFTQAVERVVEYQADLSYAIEIDKDVPDLSIEIVIAGGVTDKLQKYKKVGVPEVWFWEADKFSLYHLHGDKYDEIYSSEVLPKLDIALLQECVKLPLVEAVQEFRKASR